MDVDPITGLPKELGIFEEISKDSQQIIVSMEKKKFGKKYTILAGFSRETDVRDLAKRLKSKFACGGTHKGGKIELQGDHRHSIKDALIEIGYKAYNVKVS